MKALNPVITTVGLFFGILTCGTYAMADEANDKSEGTNWLLQGGVAQFSGDLSSQKNVAVYGIEAAGRRRYAHGSISEALGGLSGGLTADILAGLTTNQGTAFPFSQGAGVNFMSVDLGGDVCALSKYAMHVCFTYALGEMFMSQGNTNAQTYGDVPFGLKLEYVHESGLVVDARATYRSFGQTVSGKDSGFNVAEETLGIGWRF